MPMKMMALNAYGTSGFERLCKMVALNAYGNDGSKCLWKW